jgi:predicted small lipoprotein YifL
MLQRKSSVVPRPGRIVLMVLLAGLAGLAACGQKGPLTLAKPLPATPAASAPR